LASHSTVQDGALQAVKIETIQISESPYGFLRLDIYPANYIGYVGDSVKGGEKLLARLNTMSANVRDDASLRVGFLENARYEDGTPVALVAAINEYGRPDKNQPPRPFFRSMIAKHQNEWPHSLGKILVNSNYDVDKTLSLMGERIKGQLQTSITSFQDPPLSPITIARKEHAKPLIDTGHMLNSVDYEVIN